MPVPLDDAQTLRYARQRALPQVGLLGQQKLVNARVLVVGAGGLGSPALLYLAAAGIGTLGVADHDRVEESNLQRQVVHRDSDVGRLKTDSARDAVNRLNPLVAVRTHQVRLDGVSAPPVLAEYDVIVDGSDNFDTRYALNDACARLGLPYVWGSVSGFEGQVSVARPPDGPCYRCLFPAAGDLGVSDDADGADLGSCSVAGVLGSVCAAVASAQVTEVVKLLLGIGEPLVGRLLLHDALGARTRVLTVPADPDCRTCGPSAAHAVPDAPAGSHAAPESPVAPESPEARPPRPELPTVSPAELREWLADGRVLLVDVREPDHEGLPRIPGSVSIPASELTGVASPDLPAAGVALPGDRPVVLCCDSGVRSAALARQLLGTGRTGIWSLDGGIARWLVDRVARSGQSP